MNICSQTYPQLVHQLESKDIAAIRTQFPFSRYTHNFSKHVIAIAGCTALLATTFAFKGERRIYAGVVSSLLGGAAIGYSVYRDRQRQLFEYLESNIALERKRENLERIAVLRTLLWLANADGSIADEENKSLIKSAQRLEVEEFDPAEEVKSLPLDIAELLKDIYSKDKKQFLIEELIRLCFIDGVYNAFERKALFKIGHLMGEFPEFVLKMESAYAEMYLSDVQDSHAEFVEKAQAEQKESGEFSWKKAALVGGLAVGGGVAGVAAAAVAAPAIGAAVGSTLFGLNGAAAVSSGLAWLGGGSLASGGAGMAGGTTLISGVFGLGGAAKAGGAAKNLLGGLKEFQIVPAHNARHACHAIICIHGFLQEDLDVAEEWTVVAERYKHSNVLGLNWESQKLKTLYKLISKPTLNLGTSQVLSSMGKRGVKSASKRLLFPAAILSAFSVIDNPWSVAKKRSEKAGVVLGKILAEMKIPVSLLGYSLGSRVIVHALQYLKDNNIEGKVYDVWFLGGAVSKNHSLIKAKSLKKIVVNRIVNAYSNKDIVLSYLYRSAELFDLPIGLAPIDHEEILNLDVSDLVGGHLKYPKTLDVIFDCLNKKSPH